MIEGVQVIRLQTHVDERGYLIEVALKAGGEAPELWDWFFISHGSAKFVLKDDREDSPTYGETMQVVIGERNPTLLVVPPGVYHGWMSLEDDTQMVSTASHTYNREQPDEVRIPPDSFGDVWTIKGK